MMTFTVIRSKKVWLAYNFEVRSLFCYYINFAHCFVKLSRLPKYLNIVNQKIPLCVCRQNIICVPHKKCNQLSINVESFKFRSDLVINDLELLNKTRIVRKTQNIAKKLSTNCYRSDLQSVRWHLLTFSEKFGKNIGGKTEGEKMKSGTVVSITFNCFKKFR